MNHRKAEHPSNKTCRYFIKNSCWFDVNDCWYKHSSEEEMLKPTQQEEHPCIKCDETFKKENELRKHMKLEHASSVKKCRNYESKSCNWSDETCFFIHEEETKQAQEVSNDHVNIKQVFPEAQEKLPPDQISQIMKMIRKYLENLTLEK